MQLEVALQLGNSHWGLAIPYPPWRLGCKAVPLLQVGLLPPDAINPLLESLVLALHLCTSIRRLPRGIDLLKPLDARDARAQTLSPFPPGKDVVAADGLAAAWLGGGELALR